MVRVWDHNNFPRMIALFRPMLGRFLAQSTQDVFNEMIRNWEMGQDVRGKPWTPISEDTAARKGHATPLIHTRDMINSADFDVDRRNLQSTISIGTEYAAVHEYGAPDQGIPPRPVLGPAADVLADQTPRMVDAAVHTSLLAGGRGIKLTAGLGPSGRPGR